MEDKQKICDLLVPVLQETRNLKDLLTLDYDAEKEVVTATFLNGAEKHAM